MIFYKDSQGINHRSAITAKLNELAKIVEQDNFDEVLLPHPRKRYCHADEHNRCTMPESDSPKRVTEKRICRCWNYYNKSQNSTECMSCEFAFKRRNIGKYEIVDYEVPTVFSMEQLGGIDWLLRFEDNTYAAEVKPPDSAETLVRMIAETLTYTIGTSYIPAIFFFKTTTSGELSKQCLDYLKYKDSDDFLLIKNRTGLKVFYITFDEDTFIIHDAEEEPIE